MASIEDNTRLREYLNRVEQNEYFSPGQVRKARFLWALVQGHLPWISTPTICPGEDDTMALSWNLADRTVAVEIDRDWYGDGLCASWEVVYDNPDRLRCSDEMLSWSDAARAVVEYLR